MCWSKSLLAAEPKHHDGIVFKAIDHFFSRPTIEIHGHHIGLHLGRVTRDSELTEPPPSDGHGFYVSARSVRQHDVDDAIPIRIRNCGHAELPRTHGMVGKPES